jgi:NAD(P)H-hydrate epimerase
MAIAAALPLRPAPPEAQFASDADILEPVSTNFVTEAGSHVPAVTAAQMREIDRIATEETGPSLFQMMENAGRSLAAHALAVLGSNWKSARVVVLAGGGGNGGGGICAARHLANRAVDVALLLAKAARLDEVPAFQQKVFASTGGQEVQSVAGLRPDLIIDALIGYGLNSAPRGRAAELIDWANGSQVPIVALDVPSGLNATTGECPGVCIRACATITLALPKTGLVTPKVGDLWLADIGMPKAVFDRASIDYVDPFGNGFAVHLKTLNT